MKMIMHYKYIVIAILVFLVPLIMWPFKSPSQKFELRKFNPKPEFTMESLISRKYFGALGSYLTDRFPFKNEMTTIRGNFLIHLFSTSPNERARVGKNGYYFFTRGLDLPCSTFKKQQVNKYWSELEKFIAKAYSQNIIVRMIIAPQKPTIYPEFLSTDDYTRYQCARDNLELFLDKQPITTNKNYIGLWDIFKAEKEQAPDKLLHHPTDTHWNEHGALFLSKTLVNSLAEGLWDEEDVYTHPYRHQGDLGRIMGVPLYEDSEHVEVERKGINVKEGNRIRAGSNIIRRYTAISETNSEKKLLEKIVIIHDSFGKRTFTQIPPYFKETVYIHHETLGTEEAKNTISNASYVLITFSERFMYKTMQMLQQDGRIYQQLFADELQ